MGLAWFENEADYESVRAVAGRKDMPSDFSEWIILAKQFEERQQSQGIQVFRAIIKPDAFFAFCRNGGLDVNSKARIAFANAAAIFDSVFHVPPNKLVLYLFTHDSEVWKFFRNIAFRTDLIVLIS
jgi:hypothetical protein